ncbi:hypothetical protein V9L05_15255 [Bernardetia sp. Wsw4-3y2]|uniref:hypothetical protein n=1 Tax=Bernardetia sp. Wsw4-3y2 TaxID=3127471 RepID=UPI0030CCB244
MEFTEKAIGYLQGKEGYILTDTEKVKLDRCKQIAKWIVDFDEDEAIQMAITDFKLSDKQVKRYYQEAVIIYGDDTKLTRDFLLKIAIKDIRKTTRLAEKASDLKVMAQSNKNLLSLIKDFYGDTETPDFSDIQLPTVIVQYNPSLFGFEKLDRESIEKELEILTRPKRKKEMYQDVEIIDEKRKENE